MFSSILFYYYSFLNCLLFFTFTNKCNFISFLNIEVNTIIIFLFFEFKKPWEKDKIRLIYRETYNSIYYYIYEFIKLISKYIQIKLKIKQNCIQNIFIILISFLLFLINLYFEKISLIILPIQILIIYDYFLNSYFLHYLKKIISTKYLQFNIKEEKIDKDFIFQKQFNISIDTKNKLNIIKNYIITFYEFGYKDNNKKNKAFNIICNLIFLTEYYKKYNEIKGYLYPFAIIIIHTIFLILMYKLFFVELNNNLKSIYVYIFSLLWVVYVLHNVEDVLNLQYVHGDIQKFGKKYIYKTLFKNLNLLVNQNNMIKKSNSNFFKSVLNDYKRVYDQKVEITIAFVSTVIFISFLTFLSFYNTDNQPIYEDNKTLMIKILMGEG